jgi:AcrR family transcriptional regulator
MGRARRQLTRRENKELTRERLIDGTIAILRAEGVAAATTGRIAEAAGIAQSSFYGHFRDRDACLAAAAGKIGGHVLRRVERGQAALAPTDLRGSIERIYAAVVDAFAGEPELTRIFLRHRDDDGSALGRAFRDLVDRARADLAASFDRWAPFLALPRDPDGPDPRAAARAVYADMIIGATLGAIESLISGRGDRDTVLAALTDTTSSTLSAMLARKAPA